MSECVCTCVSEFRILLFLKVRRFFLSLLSSPNHLFPPQQGHTEGGPGPWWLSAQGREGAGRRAAHLHPHQLSLEAPVGPQVWL